MKHLITKASKNPIISGSAVVFIGSNLANLFAFLFNFFMVRNLSDADFGELTSLNSLVMLPLLVATALTPIVVNFAAEFFAKNQLDLVHGFYLKMVKYVVSICSGALLIFLIASPSISGFFHIEDVYLVILAGIIAFIGLVTTVNSAFLQAKLSFKFLSFNVLIAAIIKFGLGIVFVLIGMRVYGAMWAIFVSSIALFVISFYPIRFIFKKSVTPSPIPRKELFSYGVPSAFAILGLTFFITTDIFLVKHFFPPDQAGVYASIELIAKIIFFLTSSIATVMFPIIVQKRSRNEDVTPTLLISLFMVGAPSAFLTIVYFLVPELVIGLIVKKASVVSYSSLLGVFGIFISLYSLVALMTNFYLSIKKTWVAYPICLFAILQVILLWFFHSNFHEIVYVCIFLMFVLLSGLLLYYPHATKK